MSERITEKPKSSGSNLGKVLPIQRKRKIQAEMRLKSGNKVPSADLTTTLMNSMNVEEETADGAAICLGGEDHHLCTGLAVDDRLWGRK